VRRALVAGIVALAALAGMWVVPTPAVAATDPAVVEGQFVDRINALRASKGLNRLVVDGELVAVARRWATSMARADRISHNPNLGDQVKSDWVKLGENVGVGMTVPRLHDAFVASPTHYKNLVDKDFTHVGVGVVYGRDGAIFTTHQFMRLAGGRMATQPVPSHPSSPAPAPEAQPEPEPTPAPSAAPVPSARLVLVLEQLHAFDQRV
jgi:hypothetical protein